ncbi:unnamed protein product, partial [Linum tenue]
NGIRSSSKKPSPLLQSPPSSFLNPRSAPPSSAAACFSDLLPLFLSLTPSNRWRGFSNSSARGINQIDDESYPFLIPLVFLSDLPILTLPSSVLSICLPSWNQLM